MNEGKILRFTASWCFPCKQLSKELDKINIPVPVEVIDVDIHPEITADYGVRGVPTLMFVRNSFEIGRLVGIQTSEQIQYWITHCISLP